MLTFTDCEICHRLRDCTNYQTVKVCASCKVLIYKLKRKGFTDEIEQAKIWRENHPVADKIDIPSKPQAITCDYLGITYDFDRKEQVTLRCNDGNNLYMYHDDITGKVIYRCVEHKITTRKHFGMWEG